MGQISVSLRRAEDAVTVRESRREATVCISSPNGIGMASIVSPDANWPRHVTLEFRYGPGRPFRWLESCQVTAGGRTWSTSFAHAGGQGESAHGDLSADTAEISAPVLRDDAIAVFLPESLMETAGDTIQVWWVDLFRE
ncbi:MAG: hypothetical protein MUE60_05850 [Candidatus Eisenbacteria bacterium]|jgi:hypothetical protein|nr:hypothetical protein [Candidatus Eisenbacteria bacterium]